MPKRQIADRLFMFALLALVIVASLLDSTSMQYRLVQKAGLPAYISLSVLTALCLLAFADTIINDVLPDKYRIGVSLRCRQLMWMGIAATIAGYAYVALRNQVGVWVVVWYMLCSVRCVSIAFLDLSYEIQHRKGVCNA